MSSKSDEASNEVHSILKLTSQEARVFFLKQESYCNFDLPSYYRFGDLLEKVSDFLYGKDFKGLCIPKTTPRDFDDVNHVVLQNKDGRYGWRSMELIHPALYVHLVHLITEELSWILICNRFQEFANNEKLICLSMPVEASMGKDKSSQILQWWQEVEQRSIELALEYEHITHTDIADCYGSIYTHSIAWALHTKQTAKQKENRNNGTLIGNRIDNCLQDMHYGQTNGLPVGSVLMDFIAEIVLGYLDLEISKKIGELKIEDYKVLRYRDDYRIFVNSPSEGESILKIIAETSSGLGLKLSSSKTRLSHAVISEAVKADKTAWLKAKQGHNGLQKHLMLIHDFSESYPNSGSLIRALSDFHRRIVRKKVAADLVLPMISITVDIGMQNPKTHSLVAAILSKLLACLADDALRFETFAKIKKRFELVPNTGHLDIWLQRVSFTLDPSISFKEPLCQLVAGCDVTLWNNDWISSSKLKILINSKNIVDKKILGEIKNIIPTSEVQLFDY
jgi:hypothetical protein